MDEPIAFSVWLKRRRKELDVTQQALAERVGCSVVSIRKFEQETQRPSRALAARLAAQLHIAPDEWPDFIAFARFGTAVPPATMPRGQAAHPAPWRAATYADIHRQSGWLVPHTPLVGRTEECRSICAALLHADVRLLTVTGPGGVGKTRVAFAAAADLGVMGAFAHGVWSINLAPIRDHTLVLPAIAQALGVADMCPTPVLPRLCAFLRDKQLLLLLDNWEHVLDATPLLLEVLAAAPACAVLVTSRARLAVANEREVAVQPLAVPHPSHDTTVATIGQSPAVQLFVARARAAQPGFALTTANAHAIGAICQRLDGLPLAIELAATRANLLAPHLLLERLKHCLPLLTSSARDLAPRQQTLRNTIAWGYGLLDPQVQALFRRLAVFPGSWTLAAAEAVGLADQEQIGDVLHGVTTLLDHNLIRQSASPEPTARFCMLETIREFAAEQLAASGEMAVARADYAAYLRSLAERAA